jgi:hypothetical protein
MRRALSGENIMAKDNDKVPGKAKMQTCRPEQPKVRVINSELDVHAQVERFMQESVRGYQDVQPLCKENLEKGVPCDVWRI